MFAQFFLNLQIYKMEVIIMPRDEFTEPIKRKLADRVGYRCSNPNCRKFTKGASGETGEKVNNIGVAAHISAASSGGPRYDPRMKETERKGFDNGIWLCQSCAKLIDNDVTKYTVELLIEWKKKAEKLAANELEVNTHKTIPYNFYICNKCGNITFEETIRCSRCNCNETTILSIDGLYKETLSMFDKPKHNEEAIDYILEIFNKYFPNDYRTYHLNFSKITSSETLYDCYSHNDSEAVDLINKTINAAPDNKDNKNIKSEFIKTYEMLNDLSAKNKMKVNLRWLEAIKSAREGLTGKINKLYERYFTTFSDTNNYWNKYYKYLLITDDTNKNAINQSYSFVKQHQNILNQKKDKLQKYKNNLTDAYKEIEHKYLDPANKIEFFHQCLLWFFMIIAIIFSFLFADNSWDMAFLFLILTIIFKGILKFTQWVLEEIFFRKKKNLDNYFHLNKYDIFILEKYYNEYQNNISKLQTYVKENEKIYRENLRIKNEFQKRVVMEYVNSFDNDELIELIRLNTHTCTFDEFLQYEKKYNNFIKKSDELFNHNGVLFLELKNIAVEFKYRQIEPNFSPFIDLDDYAKLSRIPGKPFNEANEQ